MVTKENIIEFYEKYIRKHEDATKYTGIYFFKKDIHRGNA